MCVYMYNCITDSLCCTPETNKTLQINYTPIKILKIKKNKPTHLQSINLPQRRQKYTTEKRQSLQQEVLGKLDSHMQINEIRTLPDTIHKNKLKMD